MFKNQQGNIAIILGMILALLIVGGGAYYLSIPLLTKNGKQAETTQQVNPSPTVTASTQPTQLQLSEKFKIIVDGKELFIDKKRFENPDKDVMESVEFYQIAPDKSKIAMLAQDGISTYFLYLSDIKGENIVYIDFADEIIWSHNSKYLSYTSPITDIGPHRFMLYETESKTVKEVLDDRLESPTKYSNLQWNEDDKSISADYYSYKIPGGEKTASGKKTYPLDLFK